MASVVSSLFLDKPTELIEENIVAELKTIMDIAEAKNVISTDEATYGLQLVKELHQQGSEAEVPKETKFTDLMIMSDQVQNATFADPVTSEETGIRVPPAELSKKSFATISALGEVLKDLPQQEIEAELTVPAVDASKNLMAAETKFISKDVVEIIVIDDNETAVPQILEELHQQNSESKPGNENVAADTQLEVGTVNNSQPLMVQTQDRNNEKLSLHKKWTEITEELECLNKQTDGKLMKIEEIAKQEMAIDKEIGHMESQCSEYKRKHADYIDFYKFVIDNQLNTQKEINRLMKKNDSKAQKFLFKSFDLQIEIESQVMVKLKLHEERTELAKQVEALKLQMVEKLKEADQLNKSKEAVESEITRIESDCSERKLIYTYGRKRKTHDVQVVEEGDSAPQVPAKRIASDTAGSSHVLHP